MTGTKTVNEKISRGVLNIDALKKQSRTLLKSLRADEADARKRLREHHPKGANRKAADLKVSDAQQILAREHGFISWPEMKTHIDQMVLTEQQLATGWLTVPDTPGTLHIRCGSDIRNTLELAGFRGHFQEFSDPFCQGPVPELPLPVLMQTRADFIADAYGLNIDETQNRQHAEYSALMAAGDYRHIVLWFEHDSYDQLILAFLLDFFGALRLPGKIELICINSVPDVGKFTGLGQLAPDQLRWAWENTRTLVGDSHYELGRKVWKAVRASDPAELALFAKSASATRPIALMAKALQRHLAELPASDNDLSLTQQLVLEILDEAGPLTAGRVFGRLMRDKEPLPFLGDLMFWHVLEDMTTIAPGSEALFEIDDSKLPWAERTLTITKTGTETMRGNQRFFASYCGTRWVGGVKITADGKCPHWDVARKALI
ncbi:DUF1835 domain-containing protein [Thalassospira marina]|uniref:DUF1835 domain-containing protein n=1 Tax=Thalassospira marina TaxID=2048283 RepID=A0ABM6QEB4_9PROT|nr:DUF1835 domain-containing protein [Thalassospira marina]AUG54966.1 hypothetical protein CSC3H3_06300 [Thalassospira marina]